MGSTATISQERTASAEPRDHSKGPDTAARDVRMATDRLRSALAHHDPFASVMRDDAIALMERVRDFRRARAERIRVERDMKADR